MTSDGIQFRYTGIRVRDIDRSIGFYSVLGFRVYRRGEMEHGGIWVHLKRRGDPHRLELNYYPKGSAHFEPFRPGTELDHLGFHAKDVAGWAKRLVAAGGKLVLRVVETGENLAYIQDPDGVWIEFFGPPAPTPRRRGSKPA
jgi:lactoylglutathione lyase